LITKLDLAGNSYVGVFCSANEGYMICNPSVPARIVRKATESLETEAVVTTLGSSTILGSLMRANSYGSVVTNFVSQKELDGLKALNPVEINHKLNAVGNNILCNDNGAVVHPGFGRETVKLLEDVLQVPVVKGTIAGLKTVGSVATATNKGVICHPNIRDNEKNLLEEVLKVPATIATANYGTSYIGACLVANSKGAVVGTATTPIEIGRIEEGLVLY
jgi:translation initiation factor 6